MILNYQIAQPVNTLVGMIGDQETDVGVQFSQRNDAHLVQVPEKPASFFYLSKWSSLHQCILGFLSCLFIQRSLFPVAFTFYPPYGITSYTFSLHAFLVGMHCLNALHMKPWKYLYNGSMYVGGYKVALTAISKQWNFVFSENFTPVF